MNGKRAILTLALAFVVSCGGTAAPPASASAAAATAAVAATIAPTTATASAAAASAPGGPGQPRLLDILTVAKVTRYKVSYRITTTGPNAEAFSGDQSWYLSPPRARFDFSTSFGGQKTTVSFFSLPDGSYYCFALMGQTQCFTVLGVGSPLDQNAAVLTQRDLVDHPEQWGGTFREMRTIAGQPAYCYDVKAQRAASGVSAGLFCYSKEGIALLSQFALQGASWSMEATSVSTTVPDSDFVLPARPVRQP